MVAAWMSAPTTLVTEERALIAARLGVTVDGLAYVPTPRLANEIEYEWSQPEHQHDAWLVGE